MRGSWAGLVVAVGFTTLTNVLLLATFVYRDWIDTDAISIGYGTLVTVWLLAWWQSRWERVAAAEDTDDVSVSPAKAKRRQEQDQLFCTAQQKYLESDWVAAEQLLLKLLKQNARDIEGRLMLATLWRHQQRWQEAERQLDRLERMEAAENWQQEIAAERLRLKEGLSETAEREETTDSEAAPPVTAENTETTDTTTELPNRRMAA